MDVRLRVIVDLYPDDKPRVRFDDHGDVRALVQVGGDDDMVGLAFDDHRHLRLWAAALVDAVDRRYGAPPPPPKRADDPADPEPVGASTVIYGKGE